ncbi:anti-repressor SinI family protein [Niallia sp. 03133]|uniref:anti-repressor SinI family protein n=1 Tax=Niallia sp. 03133 TaxID=3458060 RepID=UPI004044F092
MKNQFENIHFVKPNLNQLEQKIDQEWYLLIIKAKKLGLTTSEVRKFLQERRITNPESH